MREEHTNALVELARDRETQELVSPEELKAMKKRKIWCHRKNSRR